MFNYLSQWLPSGFRYLEGSASRRPFGLFDEKTLISEDYCARLLLGW